MLVIGLLYIPLFPAEKQKAVPTTSLVLESAHHNENSFANGEFISVLRGNVVFVYGDIRIRSDEATWWRNRGEVLFRNKVTVKRGSQTITCNRMHFTRDNNTVTATGGFDFFDSTELSRLRGDKARYQITDKVFYLEGKPELVRYDTATSETLTIKSVSMIYTDSLKRATSIDSVRIDKGKLHATCRRAHYFTQGNNAQLRGAPDVRYDIHTLTGDSIDLTFEQESLRDASIMGAAHGVYADTGAGTSYDTSFTHIWGDSLYMAVSDSGMLDVIWSIGKAVSKSYESGRSEEADIASGKRMMLGFAPLGEVDILRIWGNARSTYFVEDQSGKGCNEVSGDSVSVSFSKGKVRFVVLAGSTRGTYFTVE